MYDEDRQADVAIEELEPILLPQQHFPGGRDVRRWHSDLFRQNARSLIPSCDSVKGLRNGLDDDNHADAGRGGNKDFSSLRASEEWSWTFSVGHGRGLMTADSSTTVGIDLELTPSLTAWRTKTRPSCHSSSLSHTHPVGDIGHHLVSGASSPPPRV